MKIDTSLFNNKERMRIRLLNLATMVMSLSAVNGFYTLSQKAWIFFGINTLFFITTIPVFIAKAKWEKEPPKHNEDEY